MDKTEAVQPEDNQKRENYNSQISIKMKVYVKCGQF